MDSEQQPEQFHSQPSAASRPLWIVALIIVAAIVGLIFIYFIHRAVVLKRSATTPRPTQTLSVQRTDLKATEVPDKFPPELIILEGGAAVTENYNATAAGNRFQATRSYETDKPLAQVARIYKNFFDKNGWTISNTLDESQQKVVIATKDAVKVIVSAEENAVTHARTVKVSAAILKTPTLGK